MSHDVYTELLTHPLSASHSQPKCITETEVTKSMRFTRDLLPKSH